MRLLDALYEGLLDALHGGTECVCNRCLRATDTVRGNAGDFSVCSRCRASITSRTGKAIRRLAPR